MSPSSSNPYAHGTPEHLLWARWHRAFFNQPIHGQLMAIESHLRESLTALIRICDTVPSPELQQALQAHLIDIEESVDLLNEAAEHAYYTVVSRPPPSVNGHKKP